MWSSPFPLGDTLTPILCYAAMGYIFPMLKMLIVQPKGVRMVSLCKSKQLPANPFYTPGKRRVTLN